MSVRQVYLQTYLRILKTLVPHINVSSGSLVRYMAEAQAAAIEAALKEHFNAKDANQTKDPGSFFSGPWGR